MAVEINPQIVFPGLIHLKFKTQYQLTSTMMRLQEFYESPYDDFRGNVFTVEQYMDKYVEKFGKFTYFEDWCGFNVPGHVVQSFYEAYVVQDLLEKETVLRDVIFTTIDGTWDKYYVIASCDDDDTVVQHEMAHAFYYLFDEYKERANTILDKWHMGNDISGTIFRGLRRKGYLFDVQDDETQAYFATSEMLELHEFFNEETLPWQQVLDCKLLFQEYYNEHVKRDA